MDVAGPRKRQHCAADRLDGRYRGDCKTNLNFGDCVEDASNFETNLYFCTINKFHAIPGGLPAHQILSHSIRRDMHL